MLIKKIFFLGLIFLSGVIMGAHTCVDPRQLLTIGSTLDEVVEGSLQVWKEGPDFRAKVDHPLTHSRRESYMPPDEPCTLVWFKSDGTWRANSVDYKDGIYSTIFEPNAAVVDFMKSKICESDTYKKNIYPRYGNPVLWAWLGAVSAYAQKSS